MNGNLAVAAMVGEGRLFRLRQPAGVPDAFPTTEGRPRDGLVSMGARKGPNSMACYSEQTAPARQNLPGNSSQPARIALPREIGFSAYMNPRKTILIVDDDEDLRETLAEQFDLHEEFRAVSSETAAGGMAVLKDERIDLVLLDVDLPDMDGREACRLMRKNGVSAPIVMLTGQNTDADQILGLESGANDYVAKPFKFSVLLARVRAHLRSHEQSEDAVFQIGPYEFRPAMKLLLTAEQKKIRLTEKETNILKYLYRASGKPVPRDELLHEVWGYNPAVTTHTLETHIYRLRQKIEPDPSHARLLVTESGGYRLSG